MGQPVESVLWRSGKFPAGCTKAAEKHILHILSHFFFARLSKQNVVRYDYLTCDIDFKYENNEIHSLIKDS